MPEKLAKVKSNLSANFTFSWIEETENGKYQKPITFIYKDGILNERDGKGVTRLPHSVWTEIRKDERIQRRLNDGELVEQTK